MAIIRDEIAVELPKCPRCGADARRVEIRYEAKPWRWEHEKAGLKVVKGHEARIECSTGGKCYHTLWKKFDDDDHIKHHEISQYHEDETLPTDDYEKQWQYLDALWTTQVHGYEMRKAEKGERESRRCECGYLFNPPYSNRWGQKPKRDFMYCPYCGNRRPDYEVFEKREQERRRWYA